MNAEDSPASIDHSDRTARTGGYACLVGAALMIVGAACKIAAGVDLDQALATGDLAGYLSGAADVRGLLIANLSLWIVGVFVLGVAGTLLAALGRRRAAARIGRLSYGTAVPLAIAAFVAWLALVVQLAGEVSPAELAVAEVLGWFASRADWTATVLVVGAGPLLVSLAGRSAWVPNWLLGWGVAAAGTGALTVLAMFVGGLTGYGFLIVPVGLGWTLAAGIVLLRR